MADIYIIQLIGVLLTAMGAVALSASADLYGTPLTREEKRNMDRKWEHRDVYRLPLRLETLASTVFFLGGVGILWWSKFNHCAFLARWLPDLPEALRLLLSCQ
jgi:hypothetical protein